MFAKKIDIIFSDRNKPISRINASLTIFTLYKNNYDILLSQSDIDGRITIKKEWLINEMNSMCNLFPMDYSSNIENTKPFFEIRVLNFDDTKELISNLKLWKSVNKLTDEQISCYENNNNGLYSTCTKIVELTSEDSIVVYVELKRKYRDGSSTGDGSVCSN